MKPFRFSLHAVHTLRQRKEQVAMEGYAAALSAEREAVNQLQQVQAELEAAWREWNCALVEGCPAAALAQAQHYFQAVELRRQAALATVRQAERLAQEAFGAMLLARREREAVDAFYARQRGQYDRELQRDERKALDEMAQRRQGAVLTWSAAKPVAHE